MAHVIMGHDASGCFGTSLAPRPVPFPTSGEQNALLQLYGFPLEMRIGNDTPTLNTAHLAGLVFLFRDAVGDHAVVRTDAGRAHR